MNSIPNYTILSEQYYFPIFYRAAFLDAVCGAGKWSYLLGDHDDVWVYFLKKKMGLRYIVTPQLTPYLGYWKYKGEVRKQEVEELYGRLPHHHVFIDNMYPKTPFPHQDKYTYIIPRQDAQQAWMGMSGSTRRSVKKARSSIVVKEGLNYNRFTACVIDSFKVKNRENPFPMEVLQRIETSLADKNCRKILGAVNAEGKITAVIYLLFDEKRTYNLVSAQMANDRAMHLLLWYAIEWSMNTGRSFDFEGSMIPGVEEFFKSFGGEKTAYPYVYAAKNSLVDKIVKWKNPDV